MSKAQQTQAEAIIDHAENALKYNDSVMVLKQSIWKLNQLGLNVYDFTAYKRRLEKIAGVK